MATLTASANARELQLAESATLHRMDIIALLILMMTGFVARLSMPEVVAWCY
jgi:hypothetical protein